MRFACCYSIVDEVTDYRTNGLQKHLDAAVESWGRLKGMLRTILRPFSGALPTGRHVRAVELVTSDFWEKQGRIGLYPELEALKDRFSWFRLDPRSDAIIEALGALPSKVQDRLRDKKDLEQVAACMNHLSGYLYTRIPDVPQEQDAVFLAEYGDKCLRSLVDDLSKLPAYTTETKPDVPHTQLWERVNSRIQTLTAPFAHQNMFICFLAWYVVTQLLTLAALKSTLHFLPGVRVDSVIVSLIAGGPLACAVSAVALSRSRSRGGQPRPEHD